MTQSIELRAFMGLADLFKERGWAFPLEWPMPADSLSGPRLLELTAVPASRVEVIFVNGKAFRPADAVIRAGDRVAFLPPGTPGPHRFLLGFLPPGPPGEGGK